MGWTFKKPPAVKISYSLSMEEQLARVWAGMSDAEYQALPGAPRWVDHETGTRSKCEVVMLYRMNSRIAAVSEDASQKRR